MAIPDLGGAKRAPTEPLPIRGASGGKFAHISRCFRQLAEWGYIEVIEERPGRLRGAAIEHVYRGVQRAYFDTSTQEGVPQVRSTKRLTAIFLGMASL